MTTFQIYQEIFGGKNDFCSWMSQNLHFYSKFCFQKINFTSLVFLEVLKQMSSTVDIF